MSALQQGNAAGETGLGKLTALTTLSPGGCCAVAKPQDTTPSSSRVGKHSLKHRTAGGGLEVFGPARRTGPSGSQALGHPGATGSD